jgi:DNA-binding MarR family transcriptional regulator
VNASPSPPSASTESLVEALATRLRRLDLIGWAQITKRAEELGLAFEDLRLLLALTTADGPRSVGELARISGLSLQAAYPAAHRLRSRGYLCEEQRRYSLREDGRELLANLDAAHREGIRAYVDGLGAEEREWLGGVIQLTPREK